MILIVLFTAVPKEQPRSVPASQALCRWVTRSCFSWNGSESEQTSGKCHFMEGRTESERRFSKQKYKVMLRTKFRAKHLSKLWLFFLCHVTIPVLMEVWMPHAMVPHILLALSGLLILYLPCTSFFQRFQVSKPQIFTEKPTCKCYWCNLCVGVGLLCVF